MNEMRANKRHEIPIEWRNKKIEEEENKPIDNTPRGYEKIDCEVFINHSTGEIVIIGEVDEEDEIHNCDEMGCSRDHVILRTFKRWS